MLTYVCIYQKGLSRKLGKMQGSNMLSVKWGTRDTGSAKILREILRKVRKLSRTLRLKVV